MSNEDRAWWIEVLKEESPTRARMAAIKTREADLREEMDRLGVEWDQCQEQLRECEFARRELFRTAPEDPRAKALEEKIREQYEVVARLRANNPTHAKLPEAEDRLRGLMDQREPFERAKLTVAGTTNG